MFKLIAAEMYRIWNRKDIYMLGLLIILAVGFNVLIRYAVGSDSTNVYQVVSGFMSVLIVPVFFIIMIISITTIEEFKERTLKNTISFGMPRNKIFISKIISSVILFLIAFIAILIGYIGSAFLLFKLGEAFTENVALNIALRLLCVIVLYIAAIVIGVFLGFIVNDGSIFVVTYIGVFVLIRGVINILILFWHNLSWIDKILITGNIDILSKNPTRMQMLNSVGVGLAYILIFTTLGIMIFNRKEIK